MRVSGKQQQATSQGLTQGLTHIPSSRFAFSTVKGKSSCIKNHHLQPGANLLKGFVLNPECYCSF